MTLRVFLAATRNGGYVVMPGGLTRVSASRDTRAIALHRGDGTKDTWVLSDEPVTSSFTLLRSPLSYVKPKRTGKDLPSVPPTTCSGWAAMPSAARISCASAVSSGG